MHKEIKIYFILSKMYYVQIYRMLQFVQDSSILKLTKDPDDCDVIMAECSHITTPLVQKLIDKYPQKKFVLLNKMDSPMLIPIVRQNINKDNIKIVYSAGVLTDKTNYNSSLPNLKNLEPHTCEPSGPCPRKHFPVGYFNCILNDYYKEIPKEQYKPQMPHLSDVQINKIKCAPMSRTNIEAIWRQEYYRDVEFTCDKEDYKKRDIDVSFVGQSWRGHELFGTHRQQTEKILQKIKTKHNLNTICILNHRTTTEGLKQKVEGPVLNFENYNKVLFKSKVVIGSWGAGEWCQRDAEAIYTGAVLIKPDMSHMKVFPNFYLKDKTYVSCSPDLSDLEEKILEVLGNWEDYYSMRTLAKQIINTSWNFDEHIKILEKDILSLFREEK